MRLLSRLADLVGQLLQVEIRTGVATTVPWVALTIDDGPDPATTGGLLDLLAERQARATFFVIGERAVQYPGLIARIAASGNELGNHLMHDEPSVLLDTRTFEQQLHQVDELLSAHARVRFFRPGSGWFTPRMLRAAARRGYGCAMGSSFQLIAKDYVDPAATAARLARRSHPGCIIVLHEGTAERRDVIKVAVLLMNNLSAKGLHVTSLSDLIDRARER